MSKFIQQEMPDLNNTSKKQTYYRMDVKRNIDTTKDDMNLPRSPGKRVKSISVIYFAYSG